MRAAALVGVTSWSAWQLASVPVGTGGVDRTEPGRGQSREDARMGVDRLGDAFAAGQPCSPSLSMSMTVTLKVALAGV
jgi:hypothetical protein